MYEQQLGFGYNVHVFMGSISTEYNKFMIVVTITIQVLL